jgi:hypothetical protein
MEPGGPLTGEAQAIEDAAFAHIAELHTPNTCSLREPPQLLIPSSARVRGEPGGPVEPLHSVTFETRVLSD